MSKKTSNKNLQNSTRNDDQKIQYGENKTTCFACGEQINLDTETCPYCNTKQIEKDAILK
ncbi:MAG: hypothetical protein ACFE85_11165 [Candidatus Hodarchaeota archaeon]